MERAELYLCVLRQLAVMYSSLPQHRSKMQQIYFPKLVKHSLKVLQEPSQQVQTFKPHNFAGFKKKKNCLFLGYSTLTFFFVFIFHCQILSVANQVARAVAMASLAMVCGLVEQDVISMGSETISALKSLNDYFYCPVSSSSLGNFNKRLQRPQTVDGSGSVLSKPCNVWQIKKTALI